MMTLIVEKPYALLSEGRCLRLEHQGQLVRRVPYYQIDCLLIRGKVPLCASVLRDACQAGVPVLFSGTRQAEPMAWVTTGELPGLSARRAQHRGVDHPVWSLAIARQILLAKINATALASQGLPLSSGENSLNTHLKRAAEQAGQAENADSLRGIEGFLARQWFAELGRHLPGEWAFSGRNRQPPKDPFNALLSLTYSLLQADVKQALVWRGLEPGLGFLHTPTPGRTSLVLDLLEPLRPLADLWALSLCRTRLTTKHFDQSTKQGWRLNSEGRQIYFPALTRWRQHFVESLPQSASPILWPDTPIPELTEDLGALCRHLSRMLARDICRITGTQEAPDHPAINGEDEDADQ